MKPGCACRGQRSKGRGTVAGISLAEQKAEIARVLEIAEPTVRRHWAYARSWLYAELQGARGSTETQNL